MVYLVWKRHHCNGGGTLLKITYHSKLLFTLGTVFETPDRGPGVLVRVSDQGGVSVLVVVVVVVVFIFCLLCLCFGFQLCLGSLSELPLLPFRGFLRFIQLIRVVPIGRLLQRLADKKSVTGGLICLVILSATAFCLRLSTTRARRWSISCPCATSDCRRSNSGFLRRLRHRIPEGERKLTRRYSVRAEVGPWTLFGRTILRRDGCGMRGCCFVTLSLMKRDVTLNHVFVTPSL